MLVLFVFVSLVLSHELVMGEIVCLSGPRGSPSLA